MTVASQDQAKREAPPQAESTGAKAKEAGCCPPAEQTSCCAPSQKAECCGDSHVRVCGCR
jgi:hypothetical protein